MNTCSTNDRDIAAQQNIAGLEIAWADRIAWIALDAVREALLADFYSFDDIHINVTEAVAARLLDSEQWENVPATVISDIAYEAVGKAITAARTA